MSTLVHPLNRLLMFDASCQVAFKKLKELLLNSPLLAHYDPNKPVRLAVNVPNMVFLCWQRPTCNIELFSCPPISMTLNTGLPRIMPMLMHCLDCHERPWKNEVNRVQMGTSSNHCVSNPRGHTWGSSPLSCDALHSAWLASRKMHSRRAEDLLQ